MESQLATIEGARAGALVYPSTADVEGTLDSIEAFQTLVKARLHEPRDFAQLPGTDRKTLLKPGAQKIAKLLKCSDLYTIESELLDWDRPLFHYTVKCRLVSMLDGVTVWSEGLGECNSREPRYRWRNAKRTCPVCEAEAIIKGKAEFGGGWLCFKKMDGCGAKFDIQDRAIVEQVVGRVENKDPAELVNTLLKMSRKRALVDAALSAGDLSDLFTQDMDDDFTADDGSPVAQEEATPPATRRNGGPATGTVIDGDAVAYDANGEVDSKNARQRASLDVKAIKNAGEFMEYVNARWPGHPQQDVLNSLGTKKMSDLTWSAAKVADYVKALEGFWGPGGVGQDDEEAPPEERDPDTDPTRDSEEAADVSATDGEGVGTEAISA